MITTMIMIMIMMMNVIDLGLHDKGKLAKFTTLDVTALDPPLQALLIVIMIIMMMIIIIIKTVMVIRMVITMIIDHTAFDPLVLETI